MAQLMCTERLKLHFKSDDYGYQSLGCRLPAWHDGPCEASVNFPLMEHLALQKFEKVEFVHPPIAYASLTSRTEHASCHPKEVGTYRIDRYGCWPEVVLAQGLCAECTNKMVKTLNGTE